MNDQQPNRIHLYSATVIIKMYRIFRKCCLYDEIKFSIIQTLASARLLKLIAVLWLFQVRAQLVFAMPITGRSKILVKRDGKHDFRKQFHRARYEPAAEKAKTVFGNITFRHAAPAFWNGLLRTDSTDKALSFATFTLDFHHKPERYVVCCFFPSKFTQVHPSRERPTKRKSLITSSPMKTDKFQWSIMI